MVNLTHNQVRLLLLGILLDPAASPRADIEDVARRVFAVAGWFNPAAHLARLQNTGCDAL